MRVGIDLGGSKIEGISLDADGNEKARLRRKTPKGNYDATVLAIKGLVEGLEEMAGPATLIGVGIPGSISPKTGLVKNANSTCLIGNPLNQDLETALALPVRLANDANCFTVSEAVDGAAAGAKVVFGVILGTGVGGGVAINGSPLIGPNTIAGEWGHNPLPWPKPSYTPTGASHIIEGEDPGNECYCGLSGCIETFLSGAGLTGDYKVTTGLNMDASEITAKAKSGETAAQSSIRRYENRLARALASVINVLDPDVIVLGGGLSNIESLYSTVPTIWGQWVFSDNVETKLVRNRHGDASGVRGAAWLWPPDGRSDTV